MKAVFNSMIGFFFCCLFVGGGGRVGQERDTRRTAVEELDREAKLLMGGVGCSF